jgi:signal transduction histidine kinase
LVIWILDGLLSLHREMEARVEERTAALTNEMAERSRLEREIINMSDKERWSLGHDVHDGLGQHFTATAMAAQALTRDLEDDKHKSAADGHRLVRMIEDGIGQTRRLAKGLLLVTIDEDEFVDALREMATACNSQFRVPCELRTTGRIAVVNSTVATHLFRIAQEAVRNAARHAGATSIEVRLSGDEAGLLMSIHDNGVGLPPATSHGAGMGLRIMAHRAKVIGATFEIRSAREGGTVVECRWPGDGFNSSRV